MDESPISPASQLAPELNKLMREMDALATGVREIVADLSKPWKADLASPVGWRRLQEDIYSAQFADRLSAESIIKLRRSCTAWTYRYRRLRFITATRPVWNT